VIPGAAPPRTRPTQIWPGLLVLAAGLMLLSLFTAGYTSWAIGQHSREACAELRILATAPGAVTEFDKAVQVQYQRLSRLRCAPDGR
jgi:hypothetical protein